MLVSIEEKLGTLSQHMSNDPIMSATSARLINEAKHVHNMASVRVHVKKVLSNRRFLRGDLRKKAEYVEEVRERGLPERINRTALGAVVARDPLHNRIVLLPLLLSLLSFRCGDG